MDSIRLGLISDTHCPTQMPLLPYEAIEAVFRDVDGILHAGDIDSQAVLDNLSGIAPTRAVRSESDDINLPDKRILTFGDVRVGLIHGHRHRLVESYFRFQRKLGNIYAGGRHLLESIPERFSDEPVDVIVFGHLHTPMCIERDGLILVNPGAVYSITKENAQWQLLHEIDPDRRAILQSHIKSFQESPYRHQARSTVGILEIHPDKSIHTEIHHLPLLAYA